MADYRPCELTMEILRTSHAQDSVPHSLCNHHFTDQCPVLDLTGVFGVHCGTTAVHEHSDVPYSDPVSRDHHCCQNHLPVSCDP